MALKQNTWTLNQWYDQDVAGNISYSGSKEIWVAGNNPDGCLGLNSETKYSSPVQLPGTTWTENEYHLYSDGSHVVMPKTDGTLWSWGRNSDWGQGGVNDRTDRSSPVQIGSATDWARAGTLQETSWGVKTDGTLWIWGRGYYGSLGLNQPHNTNLSSPVQIPGTTWERMYGITYSAFATKTDGTMWGWGNNSGGNLGQNDRTQRSSPVQIGDADWSQVDGSAPSNGGGIKTDGTLWLWGGNPNGNLGQNEAGDGTQRSSPTQVGSDTTWQQLSLGNKKTAAIKTDGTLWVWGRNAYGSLGMNQPDNSSYSSPVQIPGTWSSVSNSYQITFGQKTDGTLWSWGNNTSGQLGHNDKTLRSSPTQIPGTSWVYVRPFNGGNGFYASKNV